MFPNHPSVEHDDSFALLGMFMRARTENDSDTFLGVDNNDLLDASALKIMTSAENENFEELCAARSGAGGHQQLDRILSRR
jgi:ABC-type thiamine transport system substrate-binding protein